MPTGDQRADPSSSELYKREGIPERISAATSRMSFPPSSRPVTVERDLRQICAKWQDAWDQMMYDATTTASKGINDITTLADLFAYLTPIRAARIKPATQRADRHALNVWLAELGGSTPLSHLSEEDLQSAFDRCVARMKPRGANRKLATLKVYLNWAANKGLITGAPHRMVRQARIVRTHADIGWWTEEEVDLALQCARDVDAEVRTTATRNRNTNVTRNQQRGLNRSRLEAFATGELLVALGCYLGLRVEELVMQRWQDLDLDATCSRTGVPQPVCHVVPHGGWEPKDKEARTIPISTQLHELLQRYRRLEGFVLEPTVYRKRTEDGQQRSYRYDPRALWRKIIKRVVAAGGKRVTLYGMRHSFASNLLNCGVSDVKVSRWLGHANTSMVHLHYGHLLAYDDDINRRR